LPAGGGNLSDRGRGSRIVARRQERRTACAAGSAPRRSAGFVRVGRRTSARRRSFLSLSHRRRDGTFSPARVAALGWERKRRNLGAPGDRAPREGARTGPTGLRIPGGVFGERQGRADRGRG